MAAPKVKKTRVSQKIDLQKEFGLDFTGRPALREIVGQAIIDKIEERTSKGQGMKFSGGVGRPVKLKSPYSTQYKSSREYQAFNKTGRVNMKLTGDMLGQMDVLSHKANEIEVGLRAGKQAKKAFNHITGDTVPERPFFGVNGRELREIKREVKSDLTDLIKIRKEKGVRDFQNAILGFLNKLDEDTNRIDDGSGDDETEI